LANPSTKLKSSAILSFCQAGTEGSPTVSKSWKNRFLLRQCAYDGKPKRRLYEMLMAQGMQMNQRVIFVRIQVLNNTL